ncbi:MAG: SDR family oxidoreductase, partial [Propioniciclava sp.]
MAQDRFSLAGKNAVVTGGAQGIGKVVAHALAEQGANIALIDLNDASALAAEIAAAHGVRATALTCNVTDPAQVADAIAGAAAELGPLDLLFNNAGIGGGGSFVADGRDEWETTFNVCWGGVYLGCRVFMPMLL